MNSPEKTARIIRGLPFSLSRHDVVSIGSGRGCDIVIDGADDFCAELRWEEKEETWLAGKAPGAASFLINGEEVESGRLREGDRIEIAGILIAFRDGVLIEEQVEAATGLTVTLRHVSAAAGGRQRLDDISLQVTAGSFVAILGPSGCGKSTLIQRIAGLAPFEGGIFLNGHDLCKERELVQPLVAYLPQNVEDTLHGEMTVREAMKDFVAVHLAAGETPNFETALDNVGLDWRDMAGKGVRQLSGGQKRRLALALALMRDPQLLLLDEPTAGLDPAAEAGIMELMRRLANQGRTVMCATHVLGSLDLCDSVLVLAPGGRQVYQGSHDGALAHLGVSGWVEAYKALSGGEWDRCAIETPDIPIQSALPEPPSAASKAGAFLGMFRRIAASIWSGHNAPFCIGNPVGVAIVLALACGPMFGDGGNKGTICFCMAVAMFWLGLSGSVRNFVSERIPRRCLERMRGVPLPCYFASHVTFAALSSMAQSLLFTGTVFLLRHDSQHFSQNAMFAFWMVLSLVGFGGACIGLAVSAISKKEIQAVWALPFVAILALFFSKPVLEQGNGGREKLGKALRVVECAMPTLYPQECLNAEIDRYRVANYDKGRLVRCRANFALLAFAYPLVFLTLAYRMQNRREDEWDGR